MSPTMMQIVPRLDTGGSERSAVEINQAVVRAGGRSIVLSEGGRLSRQVERDGGICHVLPVGSKSVATIYRNIGRIRGLIDRYNIDIVHARSRAPAWSAFFAARRTGKHFVTTYHGAYGSKGYFKTLYNSVMARGEVVIANSRYTARLIHERHETPYDKMPIIPRGVDPALFDPRAIAPDRIAELRQQWQIKPDDIVVLQAARLTRWKGQYSLIEAAGLLHQAGRLGRAVIVMAGPLQGGGSYAELLTETIKRYGLGGRVRLVGDCDDIPAANAMAHVAVVASTEPETFGRASIEAQAAACPVIVGDLGASPETLVAAAPGVEDYTGWLFPAGDSNALADRLAVALSLSPADRAAIGARAQRHAARNFSLAAMQYRTLAVYDGLLRTRLAETFAKSHAR